MPQMRSDVCSDPAASLGNRVNAWTLGAEGPWGWRSLLAVPSQAPGCEWPRDGSRAA